MYMKFACALLAAFVSAKGDNNGINRDNAITYFQEMGNQNTTVNLYNARVQNEDGTYTYEIHGDFELSISNSSRRFMYGFCLRPENRDGEDDTADWWDCLTVKVDLRQEANVTTRFVQDARVEGDDLTTSDIFEADWLLETAHWVELEAKSNLCDPSDNVEGGIDCRDFNTHFKRDFTTDEADKDHQLSTDDAGVAYELITFVQQYDETTAIWNDSEIVTDTYIVSDLTDVTPVMDAYVAAATAADSALAAMKAALEDAKETHETLSALAI